MVVVPLALLKVTAFSPALDGDDTRVGKLCRAKSQC